nr:hypothetical protein [Bryobacterales bacterium]
MRVLNSNIAKAVGVLLLAVCAVLVLSQAPPRLTPGQIAEGVYQLPNGWRVRPAGRQIQLDTMPMASVVTPDGKYLIVLCGGYNPPSLIVLEQATLREVGRTPVPDGWLGLAINAAGDRVYVGGGTQAAVFEFTFREGSLQMGRRINLTEPAQRASTDFVGDVALSPDGQLLYVARLYRDGVDVVKLSTGEVATRFGTGRRPYRILPHPAGNFVYVSSWADGSIYRHRADTGALVDRLAVGAHSSDMLLVAGRVQFESDDEDDDDEPTPPLPYVARIFVTAGNTNSAFVVGVEENGSLALHETINLALTPRQPVGMTPSALAYDNERKRLYVVCSDANAVGVVD